MHSLGRRALHLRPSIHVSRTWSFDEAESLDDAGLLVGEIHEAINRVLGVLEEPPVQMLSALPGAEPLPPAIPVPAKRTRRSSGKKKPRKRAARAAKPSPKKALEQA